MTSPDVSPELREWPPELRERLTAYLDGELDAASARRFLAELEAHPAAWKAAEEYRRVWALLSAYADEEVPEGFAERVLAAARGDASALPLPRTGAPLRVVGSRPEGSLPEGSRPEGSLRLLASRRIVPIAAAAAVLVAAGALAWTRFGPSSPTPPPSLAVLEAIPDALLVSDDLASFASLSDEEFEAVLSADPDVLAAEAPKGRGG
jgi:anti-sigma factor RsiW